MALALVFVVMGYVMVRALRVVHFGGGGMLISINDLIDVVQSHRQRATNQQPTNQQPKRNSKHNTPKPKRNTKQGESWRLRAASERELRRRIERRADEILAEFQETYRYVTWILG